MPANWLDWVAEGRLVGFPCVMISSSKSSSLPLSSLHSLDSMGTGSEATAIGTTSTATIEAADSVFLSVERTGPNWPARGASLAVLITSPSMCNELRLVQRVRAGLSSSLKRRGCH